MNLLFCWYLLNSLHRTLHFMIFTIELHGNKQGSKYLKALPGEELVLRQVTRTRPCVSLQYLPFRSHLITQPDRCLLPAYCYVEADWKDVNDDFSEC